MESIAAMINRASGRVNKGQAGEQAPTSKYVDLVFEGGGVKGIAMVGALAVLEEQGYEVQNVAGTSAGAIVATLLAAGYTAAELRQLIANQDFSEFMDTNWIGHIPVAGASLNVLTDQGIYRGDVFLARLRHWLAAKGVHSFRDLRYNPPPGYPQPEGDRYTYKVQVVASDLTDRSFLVLPRDAHRLGIDPDDLEVALAVRMSMSIPIFFEPVRFHNPETGRTHVIVDGGVLSTYPIWLFDTDSVPDWPTFGLHLVSDPPEHRPADPPPVISRVISRLGGMDGVSFLSSLFFTMKSAHDRLYIEEHNFARTIAIPTLGVSVTDFGLSHETSMALFESGRQAAHEFLETWDFQGYIAECRRGKPQLSRRERIAQRLNAASKPGQHDILYPLAMPQTQEPELVRA